MIKKREAKKKKKKKIRKKTQPPQNTEIPDDNQERIAPHLIAKKICDVRRTTDSAMSTFHFN